MRVGVPKEVKDSEYRVGLVPSTVRELTASGHEVIVERNAGLGAGVTDADYQAGGGVPAPPAVESVGRGGWAARRRAASASASMGAGAAVGAPRGGAPRRTPAPRCARWPPGPSSCAAVSSLCRPAHLLIGPLLL